MEVQTMLATFLGRTKEAPMVPIDIINEPLCTIMLGMHLLYVVEIKFG